MQKTPTDWKKFHKFQEKPGWCGPAVIQMALLASGIVKTQEEIAKDVYQEWWGTTHQIMIAYLSRFFKQVSYKQDSTIEDVSQQLEKGYVVILDWWDDIDKEDEPGGHYSIVGEYDQTQNELTLVDPSNGRGGIWNINWEEFSKNWYDTLDVQNQIRINGWMLWVDPASKI